jgi:hypothetical protein
MLLAQLKETALDFISRLTPHLPPKGMQLVRYAGLYARNIKRKFAQIARTAREALRLQSPLSYCFSTSGPVARH